MLFYRISYLCSPVKVKCFSFSEYLLCSFQSVCPTAGMVQYVLVAFIRHTTGRQPNIQQLTVCAQMVTWRHMSLPLESPVAKKRYFSCFKYTCLHVKTQDTTTEKGPLLTKFQWHFSVSNQLHAPGPLISYVFAVDPFMVLDCTLERP